MPFITIDAITSLISDQEVFNRFMHFDENKQYFEGLTPEFVTEAVKTYVDFMNDKGQNSIENTYRVNPQLQI